MRSFLLFFFFMLSTILYGDTPIDIGRESTPTIEVRNIYLTVGERVPQGSIHWTGSLYITDTSGDCTTMYVWEKKKLVEKENKCKEEKK